MSEAKLLTSVNSEVWSKEMKALAVDTPHYRIVSPNFHHIENAILKAGYAEVTDDNLVDVLKTLRARRVESVPQPEPDHDAAMLPEAPASWNLTYYVNGRREQITLRGMTYAQIAIQATAARAWISEHADEPYIPNGHSNGAAPKQAAQPIEPVYEDIGPPDSVHGINDPSEPTGDGWERGKTQCAMIMLGTSYSGGKPQLKFHCDGFSHPLTYTKSIEDMKELLKTAGVSKPLIAGQTWNMGGAWIVDWVKPPDSKYRNVQAVAPFVPAA